LNLPPPLPAEAPRPASEPTAALLPAHAALLALGAALRLWQYGAGASQWLDELALSRGIAGRSWPALLWGPLPFGQVAPKGFVLLEKAGVALWGASDYGLRLLPLAGSLVALALFYRLATRLLARPAAVAVALALFALQPELIRYAAQVKPYACDLAVALALTLLAADLESADFRPAPGRALLLGAAAAVAVLLSHAAVLVLAGLGLALVLCAVLAGGSRRLAGLAIAAGLWTLAAAGAALAASREMTPQTHDYLRQFWAPAFGPRPHALAGDLGWAVSALAGELGAGGLGYPWVPLCAGLAGLGAIALWRRNRSLSVLLFAPTGAALAAADLHLYPFASRLVLFVAPALILAIAAGVEALALIRLPSGGRLGTTVGGRLVYFAAFLPGLAGFAADPPVYRVEETRPLLRAVAARRQPSDAIYVYYGAGQALRFYGPRYGLKPGDYLLGGCHRGDARAYLFEVDRFRGRPRLWVLVAHAQPRLGEERTLLAYLDRLGTRRLELRILPHGRGFGLPAEAFLYDLTQAQTSPAGATAATFPIAPAPAPGPAPLDPRLACAGPANPYPELPSSSKAPP
jgi:hypothetical protein